MEDFIIILMVERKRGAILRRVAETNRLNERSNEPIHFVCAHLL